MVRYCSCHVHVIVGIRAVNLSRVSIAAVNTRFERPLAGVLRGGRQGEIRSGGLAVDDRLPSEFEMAEQYGVSRDVIRRVKEKFAGEGWLIALQGRGTSIAHPESGNDG